MAFNTFNFWLIFPLIFGIYWLIPSACNNVRKVFLLLVSYLLYMNWKPAYALVLLGVTLVTYGGGIFRDVDGMEKWKMLSNLYRYNSKLFQMIGDNTHPLSNLEKGYAPIYRTMDYDPPIPKSEAKREVDSLKVQYLRKFITKAEENDVELVFVASPTWHGLYKTADNTPMTLLSEEMNVSYMDCYYDSLICSSQEYWSDGTHMNDNGAKAFSVELVSRLRKQIE